MEYTLKEVSGNTEDVTGRKKSRFKFLKVRLFGRLKRKETEGQIKQSQSTGDVTAQGGERGEDDSEDDCHYPEGTLSSRALSHDSIFLAEPTQSSQPTRVLSQENVHSKIKALQLKLQQQNIRLAPPVLIPGKRTEDSGTTSEDDGLPRSPPEMSFQEVSMQRGALKYPETKSHLSLLSLAGTGSEEEEQGGFSQPSSRPLSPVPQLLLTEPPTAAVDFTRPAQYIPTLDNSAARHRMSIKPRNQRASTKVKKAATLYRPRSCSMNNLDQPLSENEETQQTVPNLPITHQYSYDAEDSPQAKEPVSHPTSTHLQEETQLPGSPWNPMSSNNTKATERFQRKDKTDTSSSVSSDAITPLHASEHSREPLEKEPSNGSNHTNRSYVNEAHQANTSVLPPSVCSVDIASDHNIISTIDLGVSKLAETISRPHPVPVPRTKKTTLSMVNNGSSKVSRLKSVDAEKETASSSCLVESLKEDDSSLRPSSFRFNIASAKYRSRASDENIYKPDEESTGNTQKGQTYNNPNPVVEMQKVENTKSAEVCRNTPSASDKRSSLWKEVLAQNVPKTGGVDHSEWSDDCPRNTQCLKSERAGESEDQRGLFGVKLRSTSLCLKFRSELPKAEAEMKRHSLESHLIHVSCEAEEVGNDKKANVQEIPAARSMDSQQDPTFDKGSESDRRPPPAWRNAGREPARVPPSLPTKPSTQPVPASTNSTSASTPQSSPTQLLSKQPPLPRPQVPTTSKPQPVTQSSQQISPRTAPRTMERWIVSHQREEKSLVKQSTQRDDLLDYKGQSKSGAKANTQAEPDQQLPSDRTEPTWMELAKRKSLAWSDKTLDSINF